ncbi:putative nuclease HARBI1 isoform X1 [Hyla sarda]|uniref:putative nuclease HARBI1 isoform X1 n=1 Tax=Hyla sarda TaxID=327740 RepID=UPI0024C224D8|nr:putative nuclease HARBI1 isoform X1 [Hyla sarda]XP_056419659.1 putative nuclease HARBI1 isoform X1 [Hyla sarda]XP_056419660.1 putative nuclease HARBI1 isoform X1 [Hyla sarda]
MEAFGPVMLYLLQVEEDEKKEKPNPRPRRHHRPSPSGQKPQPKPKRPQPQKPQVLGIRRPRIFRERTGMEGLTDEEVMERFRLTKRSIIDLYELIRVDIDPLTQRSHAIPGIVKLLNCLHFFSTGSFQTKASAIGGVSQSTFSRFLVPVIQALKKHVHTFIYFPTDKATWQQLKNGFSSVAGIPHVMGVLDCIHIALSAPHEQEEIYRNKKGYHSVNVQMIVDSNCKILSLFSAFPGSSQNSSILRQSSVYEGFESGRLSGGWLLEVKYECPSFDPAICLYAKPGRAECRNDSQCTSPMKCCCSNCGWKCMDPVEVKTGRCPLVFAKCRMPYPKPTCHKDSDCPGLKKCCSICGYNCWDPAPEPPGVCPKNDGETLSELQCSSVQCSRDTDCGANEKCCTSGDEQKCVEPVVC